MSEWDHTPHQSAGAFLDLKNKGDSVNIRIAGVTHHEIKVFRDGEVKPVPDEQVYRLSEEDLDELRKKKTAEGKDAYSVSDKYSWVVLDRDKQSEAKVFTGTAGVFNKIKRLATDERWGDVSTYDLCITRTEAPGANYYEVMPDPRKSALTAEEVERAAAVDIASIKPFSKSLADTPAPASVDADPLARAATAPAAEATAAPAQKSLADEL